MSNTGNPSVPVVNSTASTTAATPASTTPTTAAAAGFTGGDTANNMSELKTKAPQVYNALMMAYAQTITSDMQHHQDNLKKIMAEERQQAGG